MKHNAMIYELLSVLDTAIGENKCGIVLVEVAFLICAITFLQIQLNSIVI